MTATAPRLFISHSNRDQLAAEKLIALLQRALGLPDSEIRCTSAPRYRLPGGARTSDQLRDEVNGCDVLIGLISPSGMASTYVLFEFGARWGAKRSFIPVLVPGSDTAILKGPLQEIHALNCALAEDLTRLVSQVSEQLGVSLPPADTYLAEQQDVLDLRKGPPLSGKQQQALRFFAGAPRKFFYSAALAQALDTDLRDATDQALYLHSVGLLDRKWEKFGATHRINEFGADTAFAYGFDRE